MTTSVQPQPVEERDLSAADARLADLPATGRVAWAVEHWGDRLVLSTSFGIQSAVMLHMATRVKPDIPVVFIDTGYLFPETYAFADQLTERLGLNLKVYQPLVSAAWQEQRYGKRWEQGLEELEAYNRDNKVEPMNRALRDLGAEAWMSGVRRSQSTSRQTIPFIERQNRTTKIYPIADWDERTIYQYLTENDLPYHPLWEEGYVSVGDVHSTSKLMDGMNPEDTRFNGLKRECGLHEDTGQMDYQI
ncbi:MAG: phosphoadenylyl-sulfate reductase [Opitutales bacterium]